MIYHVCIWFLFRLLVLTIDDLKDLGIQSLGHRLEILVCFSLSRALVAHSKIIFILVKLTIAHYIFYKGSNIAFTDRK